MSLEAYMWIANNDQAIQCEGRITIAGDKHYGWVKLRDFVHKLSPKVKMFEIMKKLDGYTPEMANWCMNGTVIDRVFVHSTNGGTTLAMYELRNVVFLSTESRDSAEEYPDHELEAIQVIAENSVATPTQTHTKLVSADRYELFQAVCSHVIITRGPGGGYTSQHTAGTGSPLPPFATGAS